MKCDNTNKKTNLEVRDMCEFENNRFLLDLEKKLIKLSNIQHSPVNESITAFINIFETTLQLYASLRNIICKKT